MFKLNRIVFIKITSAILIALTAVSCGKDQNAFLPNVQVNFSLTPYELSFLEVSGNSIVFTNQGVNGVIVVCVDPNSSQYFAYDATCPYEKDYSGVVTVQAVKNYTSPPYTIFSSDFYGVCNKCGSKFNLMGGGQPVSGPATHYLQNYNVLSGFGTLTVTH